MGKASGIEKSKAWYEAIYSLDKNLWVLKTAQDISKARGGRYGGFDAHQDVDNEVVLLVNDRADRLAGDMAKEVQVRKSTVDRLKLHEAQIKTIRERLVITRMAAISEDPLQPKTTDTQPRTHRESRKNTELKAAKNATEHNVVWKSGNLWCDKCLSAPAVGARARLEWLKGNCHEIGLQRASGFAQRPVYVGEGGVTLGVAMKTHRYMNHTNQSITDTAGSGFVRAVDVWQLKCSRNSRNRVTTFSGDLGVIIWQRWRRADIQVIAKRQTLSTTA